MKNRFNKETYKPSCDAERQRQEDARNYCRLRQYEKRLEKAPGFLLQLATMQRLHSYIMRRMNELMPQKVV